MKNYKSKNKVILISSICTICIISTSIAFISTNYISNKNTTPSESSEIKIVEDIKSMDINKNIFPALNIEVPTKVPVPEYIQFGENHEIIKDIQERLMELHFMEFDEPSTYYGPVTESAIKIFQRQNGFSQDGIVGETTFKALFDENAKSYLVKKDDSGEDIRRIQQRLYDLGYLADTSMISGMFGEKTDEAVKKFQERNGLDQDGAVGIKSIDILYSDDVKANMAAFGEKSDVVLSLQKKLFDLGYMTSTPDGTYGNDTLLAVKRFQSKNNIIQDGYLGPETRLRLLSNDAMPNSLDLGDDGEQVEKIQNLLVKYSYLSASKATGYYNESTKDAVKAFQKRHKLTDDGKVGALTIAKLTSNTVLKALPKTNTQKSNSNVSVAKNSPKPNRDAGSSTSGVSTSPAPAAASNSNGVNALISVASSKLGTPYVWGSKGPSSFDCSGFVYWCLNNVGVSQSYLTSSGWRNANKYTRINNFSDIQAGDIVVVSGHVGIAIGNGEVIDASSSNGRVVRRSLSGWWANNFKVAWRIF